MAPDEVANTFDPDRVRARYRAERDRRMVDGRNDICDLTGDEHLAKYLADPFAPRRERDPVHDDVEIAIIGGGLAGVIAGVNLRKAGVDRIRIIDDAGGIGGTWYWNRYPGVTSDIESYIYLPMLEELDYIPTARYTSGAEILGHLEAIAERYDLVEDALFHTRVEGTSWDEVAARWVVRTDRGDEVRARYLVLAVGVLNALKLPAIPGLADFAGHSFHTARWDYAYTGGGPDADLANLGDKVVGIVGAGASGIQCIPALAASAGRLVVFQRTPSAIGVRDNRPTDPDFASRTYPGWQRDRMDNFQAVMGGLAVEADLTNDGWTLQLAKVFNTRIDRTLPLEDNLLNVERVDYAVMEEHRQRVSATVSDPRTAEMLKPYYRFLCKRPCFHDEYLDVYNSPTVTLVDCPAGIDHFTKRGAVVDNIEYELDCVVFATGFEGPTPEVARRAGCDFIGRGGVSLAAKWSDGVRSLHGMMTRGFPNLFLMPAPLQQSVVTWNYTSLVTVAAEHVAATYAKLQELDVAVFDVSLAAETAWVQTILDAYVDRTPFIATCTPSPLTLEGDVSVVNPLNGSYGGGAGDYFGFRDLLAEWRQGGLTGLELDQPHDQSR